MDDEPNLYREPEEVLRRELAHLKERLKGEEAELAKYEGLVGKRDGSLDALVDQVTADVEMTRSLIVDYRSAVRKVVGRRAK